MNHHPPTPDFFGRHLPNADALPPPRDPLRLLAPILAVLAVALVVIVLVVLTWNAGRREAVLEVEIASVTEIEDLQEAPEKPEEVAPDIDVAVGSVDVAVDAPALPVLNEVLADFNAPTMLESVPQPTPLESVALVKSPVTMKTIAGSARGAAGRAQALKRFGGSGNAEASVLRALRWLKTQQRADGSWKAKGEGDPTAFALLAYLSHGESIASPEFGQTVKKAVERLVERHNNNMAVYALAEAAAVMRTPVLTEIAEEAVTELCLRQQTQVKANAGGVIPRYCAVMAMVSAKLAKLKVTDLAATMTNFADGYCAMRDAKGPDFTKIKGLGTWHYMIAGTCLQYLGHGADNATRQMLRRLDEIWVPATLGKTPIACCPVRSNYFSTMIFFNAGGPLWGKWNRGMLEAYANSQTVERGKYVDERGQPQETGFWRCQDQHIGDQPFWTTCYIAHQLMVYYRYLPTYSEEAWSATPKTTTAPSREKDAVIVEVDL